MQEATYEVSELAEAYYEASPDDPGRMFTPWSLFKEAYDGNAADDFLQAVDNGDIEIVEKKAGIRADGHWPRYNTGRLWLEFNY